MEDDLVWTIEEAAKILKTKRRTIARLVVDGDLPAIDLTPKGKKRSWRIAKQLVILKLEQILMPNNTRKSVAPATENVRVGSASKGEPPLNRFSDRRGKAV